ncbi:MAG: alpha/beta hydrolase [Luteibaculaceae bacterium]
MKKIGVFTLVTFLVLGVTYFIGPKQELGTLSYSLPKPSQEFIDNLLAQEQSFAQLMPGCEAEIVWANDSTKEKTDLVVLYLHGFTACKEEGEPLHRELANLLNANLYMPRLLDHGLAKENTFEFLTPENYYNSALEALAVAKTLGSKVVLMGTSTGCTFAIDFAARFPELIKSLLFFSPNIDLNDKKSHLLTKPWGLQISRAFHGGLYNTGDFIPLEANSHWQKSYRLEGQITLRLLLDHLMRVETFQKITQPTYVAYYYKDENNYDKVVSVDAMKHFFETISTPHNQKKMVPFAEPENHVLIRYNEQEAYQKIKESLFDFVQRTH